MPEPIWQTNLRDAILLDPLVLIHGNVKDLFYVPPSKRKRLPPHWQERSYVSFDVWLALEFEEAGFGVVVLYDMADGAVVLRKDMAAQFYRGRPATVGEEEMLHSRPRELLPAKRPPRPQRPQAPAASHRPFRLANPRHPRVRSPTGWYVST